MSLNIRASWSRLLTIVIVSAASMLNAADVTGAIIDESQVQVDLIVDPAGAEGTYPTITEALTASLVGLHQGKATRVRIRPGVYRESAMSVRFTGKALSTLLVIEGDTGAVWTGADPVSDDQWRDEGGGLWSTPWTHRFGVACDPWGVGVGVGPRREMAFLGERPLRPIALDDWVGEGLGHWEGKPVRWTLRGSHDPRLALTEAYQFGVIEQGPEAGRLWLRLPEWERPSGFEVTVRGRLLDLTGKSNVVLRNLTITRCAVGQRFWMYDHPIHVGGSAEEGLGDVLIDRCRFTWHSGTALRVNGWRWTIRDTECSWNGYSGITADNVRNLLFERVTTNGNCWREHLAGIEDWCFAAFKVHAVQGHKVIDHTSIGNAGHGLWWDVHCMDVEVDGATSMYNRRSVIFELSAGPFSARRVLAAQGWRRGHDDAGAMDPVVCFSCTGRASIESSIVWSDRAKDLFGVSWYERDDPHAKQRILIPDVHRISDSVIAGAGMARWAVREENVGDRKAEGYRTFRLVTRDNLYWIPEREQLFQWKDRAYQPQGADLSQWSAVRGDTGSSIADPGFVDPANGDFRITADSPLQGRRDLPLIRIDPAALARARAHLDWMGWPEP